MVLIKFFETAVNLLNVYPFVQMKHRNAFQTQTEIASNLDFFPYYYFDHWK